MRNAVHLSSSWAGIVAASMCLCLAALGAEGPAGDAGPRVDLTELTLEELMDVEITSVSKRKEKRREAAAAVFVITAEDIRRSGATTVAELLRIVPGLNVARLDSSKWAVSSRGFNDRVSNKLLVLVDGRTVYTPLFAGVYWYLQDLVLEDIERIEVVRGPGGTIWGANAVNGVINITTKHARNTQGGLLSATAGTEDRLLGGLRYGGTIGEDAFYRLFVKHTERDDMALPSGRAGADNWGAWRAGVRLDWDLAEAETLSLLGEWLDGNEGQTYVLPTPWPPFTWEDDVDSSTRAGNLVLRYARTFSDTSEMALQVCYDRLDLEDVVGIDIRDTYDVDFQHRFALGDRHDIVWGAGFRYTENEEGNTRYAWFEPSERRDRLFSAFIQDEVELIEDRLRLTLGSKFEHNDYTGFEVQPSVRLAWLPGERHMVWAAVSRAVRTLPQADSDLRLVAAAFPLGRVLVFGDPDLGSEELLAWEAGYRYTPGDRLSVDVAAFFNQYRHLRTLEPGLPFISLWTIPGRVIVPVYGDDTLDADTCGLELSVAWQATPWWRLRGAYSYLNVDYHLHPRTLSVLSQPLTAKAPRHQVGLESRMNLGDHVEFDAMFRYVDELEDLGVEGYTDLSLRLGWRPSEDLEISVVGHNLLAEHHQEFDASFLNTVPTQIERGVYGKVTWRF